MKRVGLIFAAVLAFWGGALFAAVNAMNGVAVSSSSTILGKTPNSAVMGQTLASGSSGLLTGLTAYYQFEETSGNAADSTANALNLTLNGTLSSTTGKIGNARAYDANTANFFSITSNSFRPGSASFSCTFWVYANTLSQSSFPGLVGMRTASNFEWWALWHHSSSTLRSGISSNGTNETDAIWGSGLSATTWYLMAVVWDGANIKTSVNGGAFVSTAFTGPVFGGTAPFIVGKRADGGSAWDGIIDELAFWNGRALTLTDIGLIYNSGSGLPYSSW